jgi:Dyp-type peroxidase family
MTAEIGKLLVRRFVEEILNAKNPGAVGEFVSADAVEHLQQSLSMFLIFTAVPDFRVTIDDLLADGDKVVCLGTWQGTHSGAFTGRRGTGKRVVGTMTDTYRIDAGKIVESWHNWSISSLIEPMPGQGNYAPVTPPADQLEPVLEVGEIQGNILAGFNKDFQKLIFLEITEEKAAKAWLREITPLVATLEEVYGFNKVYKEIRRRRGAVRGVVQSTWMNVAISFGGLQKLTSDAELFTDESFKAGLSARSTALGDPADEEADGNSNNWVIGGSSNTPDIMLIVASDDRERLAVEVQRIEESLTNGLRIMFAQEGHNLPPPLSGGEHFGFRDGISQPAIRGRLSEDDDDFLTPRENPADINQGKPGQDLIWPGEFVFGYPRQNPAEKSVPGDIAVAGPSWAKNGSFLVFRRLRQDVDKFRKFTRAATKALVKKNPAFTGLTSTQLSAKLVGRWTSGAPLMRSPLIDRPEIARDGCTDNHFLYVQPSTPIEPSGDGYCVDEFPPAPGDDAGLICPHAAHIRKAYPRDDLTSGGGTDETQTHRLLRRGIPFGEPAPDKGEKGLLFIAFQTSIEQQFEFIIRNWINNPDFRNFGDGHDPLIGQNGNSADRKRFFRLPVKNSEGAVMSVDLELDDEWIVPTGGGYFFSPSITALKLLAD